LPGTRQNTSGTGVGWHVPEQRRSRLRWAWGT
jgi:hypothetical protein